MFLLKKKNIIRLGFYLGLTKISKYQFLLNIILSSNQFYSILNLKFLTYKLLMLKQFLKIYKLKNKKIMMVDGTLVDSERLFYKKYLKDSGHKYIDKDTWIPNAFEYLNLNDVNFIIFWNYGSLILNLKPNKINVPFLFFFQGLIPFFMHLHLKKFQNCHFIFSSINSISNNFFWLCIFLTLVEKT